MLLSPMSALKRMTDSSQTLRQVRKVPIPEVIGAFDHGIGSFPLQHLKHLEVRPRALREPVAIEQMRFNQPYFSGSRLEVGVVRK